jgi:hypothetical protein
MSRRLLALAGSVALLSACGPTPPQAPLKYAKKLDESTGAISTACGEADQLTAFPPVDHHDFVVVEATAISAAQKLAGVYHRNPNWIYQSDKISALVHDSVTMLEQCGLAPAADVLKHAVKP